MIAKYGFRAECWSDVARASSLLVNAGIKSWTCRFLWEGLPDVEVEFSCGLTLEEIKKRLSLIPDGHVMLETVGEGHWVERDYSSASQQGVVTKLQIEIGDSNLEAYSIDSKCVIPVKEMIRLLGEEAGTYVSPDDKFMLELAGTEGVETVTIAKAINIINALAAKGDSVAFFLQRALMIEGFEQSLWSAQIK